MKFTKKKAHEFLKAAEQPLVSGDQTFRGSKHSGAGSVRYSFALPPMLFRMAQKIVHERVKPPKEKDTVGNRTKCGAPKRLLTNEQMRQILAAYDAGGISQKKLAQVYGVSTGCISNVINGYTKIA